MQSHFSQKCDCCLMDEKHCNKQCFFVGRLVGMEENGSFQLNWMARNMMKNDCDSEEIGKTGLLIRGTSRNCYKSVWFF